MDAPQNIRKKAEYEDFALWSALTPTIRKEVGEPKSQAKFAKKYGVSEVTLSLWKGNPLFWELRNKILKRLKREDTPRVMEALLKMATGGNLDAIKFWLGYIEEEDIKQESAAIKNNINIFATVEDEQSYYLEEGDIIEQDGVVKTKSPEDDTNESREINPAAQG